MRPSTYTTEKSNHSRALRGPLCLMKDDEQRNRFFATDLREAGYMLAFALVGLLCGIGVGATSGILIASSVIGATAGKWLARILANKDSQ